MDLVAILVPLGVAVSSGDAGEGLPLFVGLSRQGQVSRVAVHDSTQHLPQPQGKQAHVRRHLRSAQRGVSYVSRLRHQELYMALATLSPKERSAVVMFYMSGYSVKEIADITDCTIDAVKKQLSRGRDNLKTILNV